MSNLDLRFGRVIINAKTDTPAYIIGYEYDEDYNLVLKLSNGEKCLPSEVTIRYLKAEEKKKLLRVKKYLEMFCSDGKPLNKPSII